MNQTEHAGSTRFRVWIAGYRDRRAADRPAAVALQPAEEGTMSAVQAEVYVEAFNRSAALRGRDVCAVAVPVTVEYRGDPRPGEAIGRVFHHEDAHKKSPLLVSQVSTCNGLPPREYT